MSLHDSAPLGTMPPMEGIVIEKGIPLPAVRPGLRATIDSLETGQSFLVPARYAKGSATKIVVEANRAHKPFRRFSGRTVMLEGVRRSRIWRVK